MVFRSFDRKIFAKLESNEGQPATTARTDYIETIEPTFSVTNRVFDRDPTRMAITPAPKTVTGTGSGSGLPSASVEISFGVELAGAGTEEFYSTTGTEKYASAETGASTPRWGRLLQACGMEQVDAIRGIANVDDMAAASGSPPQPFILRHRENVSYGADSGTPVTSYIGGAGTATRMGRAFGTHFYESSQFLWYNGGNFGTCSDAAGNASATACHAIGTPGDETWTFADPAANNRIYGQATSEWAGTVINTSPMVGTAGSVDSQRLGPGWCPTSGGALGGTDDTSLTIDLYLSDTDQYIQATGCRGNVEFVFASGDRVLMNFTFTGKLEKYDDAGTSKTATGEEVEQPPGCTDFSLKFWNGSYDQNNVSKWTGAIFNAMTLNLGNEVTIRENMDDPTGYDAAYITGRSSSLTFNPDANIPSAVSRPEAFWDRFLGGGALSLDFQIGAVEATHACGGLGDGNSFLFRVPAMQFSGIADGNRDEVMVLDSTTSMTGGDMGESVQEEMTDTANTSVPIDARLGTDNEFTLVLF